MSVLPERFALASRLPPEEMSKSNERTKNENNERADADSGFMSVYVLLYISASRV